MTDRPSRQSERLPAVLLDPNLLDEGDYWTWTCGVCATMIQGGRSGLALHCQVIHPERTE